MVTRILCFSVNGLLCGLAVLSAPISAAIVSSGNVTPNVNTWTSTTTGYIGDTSNGSVSVDAGSTLTLRDGYLGYRSRGIGTVTVTGIGSKWINSNSLVIGLAGSGTLIIEAGGEVRSARGRVSITSFGFYSGSKGSVTVTDAGSKWINTGWLQVDRNGVLTVSDGGEVVAGTLLASLDNLSGDGTITATGALLDADLVLDATTGSQLILPFGSGGTLTIQPARGLLGVGYQQSGSLTVSEGVNITSFDSYLGYDFGAMGTATVTGAGSKWTNNDRLLVGVGGSGTLIVEAGGQVNNAYGYLGYFDPYSTGTAIITGIGSKWINNGYLRVSHGGQGTLVVSDGGEVEAGALYASLTDLSGDGLITTRGAVMDIDLVFDAAHGTQQSFAFGSGGTLIVNANGGDLGAGYKESGSLTVADGVNVCSNRGVLGDNIGSTGIATVKGMGSTWTNDWLNVGNSGNGKLTIEAGGQVRSAGGSLGSDTGSTGTVTVTGAGSMWTNDGDLTIGGYGIGTLTIKAGGQVANDRGYLGGQLGSTATVRVTGIGSKLTSSYLSVGAWSGGSATLTIEDGGLVSVGRLDIYSTGFINMSTGGMLALPEDYFSWIIDTEHIRFWDASIQDWSPLTTATYGTDYTLSYLTTGDLAGYTLLTVGTAIPEPATWLLAWGLAIFVCAVRRSPETSVS